jgi:hypothetical protein
MIVLTQLRIPSTVVVHNKITCGQRDHPNATQRGLVCLRALELSHAGCRLQRNDPPASSRRLAARWAYSVSSTRSMMSASCRTSKVAARRPATPLSLAAFRASKAASWPALLVLTLD